MLGQDMAEKKYHDSGVEKPSIDRHEHVLQRDWRFSLFAASRLVFAASLLSRGSRKTSGTRVDLRIIETLL